MRYPLPYAFARNQQSLLEDSGDTLTLWVHPQSPAAGMAEAHAPPPRDRVEVEAAALCSSASAPRMRKENPARPRWSARLKAMPI